MEGSQLPGRGPTDVDVAPVLKYKSIDEQNLLILDWSYMHHSEPLPKTFEGPQQAFEGKNC